MLYEEFIPLFFHFKNYKMILSLILDNFLFSGYLACQQIGPLGGPATFGIPVVRSLGSIASPITLTAQPLEPRVNETYSFRIISYQELVWIFWLFCFKMVTLNIFIVISLLRIFRHCHGTPINKTKLIAFREFLIVVNRCEIVIHG